MKISQLSMFLLATLALLMAGFGESAAQQIPPEVASNADQWPLPNGNYSNTRAASNSTISSGKLNQLHVAWSFVISERFRANSSLAATSPIILDDTLFLQDLQSNIFALDVTSGAVQWERLYNEQNVGPNGLSVGWGKVFGPSSIGSITALDKENGETLWSIDLIDEASIAPPIPFDDTLYAGLGAPPPSGTTGNVRALDPETGATRWNFNTVLSPDLWGHPELNFGGSVWYPPAIDVERGIVYASVANPSPWAGTPEFPNGSSRPGDNLYTNSLVALDHQTGELKWFNQVKPHDLFDHDFQLSPILATVEIGGNDRDIVIGAGKLGRVFAFDRDTGQTLWDTPVGIHQNDELTELPPGGTIVYPGAFGGVLTPMAYAEGVVFAPVINSGRNYTPISKGNSIGPATGELVALDAATGAILWSTEFDTMVVGGATVVNDLVFTSTLDGMIYALDRQTGAPLWTYQAEGGINAWPAVAGNTIVFPVGISRGRNSGEKPHLLAFVIPEPSTLALAALGFVGLFSRRWEKSHFPELRPDLGRPDLGPAEK